MARHAFPGPGAPRGSLGPCTHGRGHERPARLRVSSHTRRVSPGHTRAGMAVTGLRLEGSRVPDWPVPALASECGPVHLLPPSIFFFLLLFYKERACFFIRTKKRSFLRGCQRRDRLIVL